MSPWKWNISKRQPTLPVPPAFALFLFDPELGSSTDMPP
jgi:hypothetical protein